MTDDELLSFAARASGLSLLHPDKDGDEYLLSYDKAWNPLADDGDALRLAVKLQFDVIPKWGENCVCIIGGGDHFEEPQQPDIYAAMRRAIVRAAAAIGSKL